MANNFLENYRNTPGIVYNTTNNQRLSFARQAPYYDARNTSIKNLDRAERNFGVSERSYNALMDRGIIRDDINRIQPLRVKDDEGSPKFEASPTDKNPNLMKIWRLDGRPFDLNSYLNSVERVIRDVSSSNDEESLLSALKRGYSEWGMNNHVLGNSDTRTNDFYDSTAATMVRHLYDAVKDNEQNDDFETLKANSIEELRSQFIPKWIGEGREI